MQFSNLYIPDTTTSKQLGLYIIGVLEGDLEGEIKLRSVLACLQTRVIIVHESKHLAQLLHKYRREYEAQLCELFEDVYFPPRDRELLLSGLISTPYYWATSTAEHRRTRFVEHSPQTIAIRTITDLRRQADSVIGCLLAHPHRTRGPPWNYARAHERAKTRYASIERRLHQDCSKLLDGLTPKIGSDTPSTRCLTSIIQASRSVAIVSSAYDLLPDRRTRTLYAKLASLQPKRINLGSI